MHHLLSYDQSPVFLILFLMFGEVLHRELRNLNVFDTVSNVGKFFAVFGVQEPKPFCEKNLMYSQNRIILPSMPSAM